MDKKIIILGAGLAGTSCAFELSKAGQKPLVIEKNGQIGGLAKTLTFQEGDLVFKSDLGPHRFFSKNQKVYDMMGGLLKDDWKKIARQTRQLIEGKFYDYPINASQALKNVGWKRATMIVFSYLWAMLVYRVFGKKINDFEDYIVANFGRKLGEFNMLNYTEKIFGISCRQIHANWAEERIEGLSLFKVFKKIFLPKNKDNLKTFVENFYYPNQGNVSICRVMSREVEDNGGKIITGSYPVKIKHDHNRMKEAELNLAGENSVETLDFLVSSIPPNELLNIFDPLPPAEVLEAASKLKWRSQVYLFVTLEKKKISGDHWIYLPEKNIPFGRISEMKNFSSTMAPENQTILAVEYFVNRGDDVWNKSKEELTELTAEEAEKLGLFKKEEIRNSYLAKEEYVYPLYDLDYQVNLKIVKDYLDTFKNLFCIGRTGCFQYTNQDQAIESGLINAAMILAENE